MYVMSYISIEEDYLNEHLREDYLKFCKETNLWDNFKTDDIWSQRIIYSNQFPDFELNYKHFLVLLQDKIKTDFSITKEIYPDYLGLVRWHAGDFQHPHADSEIDGQIHPYHWRHFGCIYYLNDDYEGGEIYFPNQNIELKPKPNTLIFFPGTLEFLHGVKPVTNGVRYTLSSFWTYDKQYSIVR
jgi:hypothetical protein